jgi:hypothetical protein
MLSACYSVSSLSRSRISPFPYSVAGAIKILTGFLPFRRDSQRRLLLRRDSSLTHPSIRRYSPLLAFSILILPIQKSIAGTAILTVSRICNLILSRDYSLRRDSHLSLRRITHLLRRYSLRRNYPASYSLNSIYSINSMQSVKITVEYTKLLLNH